MTQMQLPTLGTPPWDATAEPMRAAVGVSWVTAAARPTTASRPFVPAAEAPRLVSSSSAVSATASAAPRHCSCAMTVASAAATPLRASRHSACLGAAAVTGVKSEDSGDIFWCIQTGRHQRLAGVCFCLF